MAEAVASLRTRDWRSFFQRYGLLLSFGLLCLALTLLSDRFLTPNNLTNVLRQSTVNGIISVGMMMVILTRGIDLCVGSVLALTAVVMADAVTSGAGWTAALLIGMGLGGALGVVNGAVVTRLRVPPFIATLGMMVFARGLALTYTEGRPITGLDPAFRALGTGFVGSIPMPIVLAGVVFVAAYVLLYHTRFGRHIYAIGDNEVAARLSGIGVKRYIAFVYAAAGALAALAGAIEIARLNSAQPTLGQGYEFDAIAAVVVGGTSFEGGEGTLWGTLLGVLFIAVLNNGLNLLNVPSFYQDVVRGAVIALALLIHRAIR
ncbi:MAG: ABC transporter permease [Anaerolineae bacterium]